MHWVRQAAVAADSAVHCRATVYRHPAIVVAGFVAAVAYFAVAVADFVAGFVVAVADFAVAVVGFVAVATVVVQLESFDLLVDLDPFRRCKEREFI